MRHSLAVTALAGAAVLSSASPAGQARSPSSWPLRIQPVASPSAPGSGQPQLTTSPRGVLLSWIERTGGRATLKFVERTTAGWSTVRTVASGTDWFVNWADVPSVLRTEDGALAAHWLQKSGPGSYAYDVRLAHSADDGRTWSAAFSPHHDRTKTEHGFASLFGMAGGGVGLIWLDGRNMSPDSGHAHGQGTGGAMSLRFAAFDRRWTQTTDTELDVRVCECCPTAAVVTAEGILAAYRNRADDETRDIYLARFDGARWTSGTAVHEDGWRIAACPVNGPSLSADGRRVAIAWFTARGDEGRTLVAFSSDAGRSFGPPVRVDDGRALGRVDVELLPDGSAAATWIELAGGRAEFRVRRIEPSGGRSAALTVAAVAGSRSSGYPRLARHGRELVFAWTESPQQAAATRVRTAVARVP